MEGGRLVSSIKADEWEKLSELTDEFDKNCLVAVAAAPTDPTGLDLAQVAILTDPAEGPYCMAAYLGGGRFLTANHCRFYYKSLKLRQGLTVSLANGEHHNLPLVFTAPSVGSSLRGADDLAEFHVEFLRDHRLTHPVTIGTAAINRESRLVGYFALADMPNALARGVRPAWPIALRATRDHGVRNCQIRNVTTWRASDGRGCLIHSCQSINGFSGAPLFARGVTGSWELVGIHVAGNDPEQRTACPGLSYADFFVSAGNVAALIPPAITARAMKGF